jgi:hypothetical protein
VQLNVVFVLDTALNCLTRGGVCKALRALLKGVWRAHDTAAFYGSWLPGIFQVPESLLDEWDPPELWLVAQCLRWVSVKGTHESVSSGWHVA